MAEFQNLLTPIQVHGPPDPGVESEHSDKNRIFKPGGMNYLLGKIGDAQIGPFYLGWLGILSLLFGFAAFEIIGFSMLASVNWDVVEFIRQLPWLSLDPPPLELDRQIKGLKRLEINIPADAAVDGTSTINVRLFK